MPTIKQRNIIMVRVTREQYEFYQLISLSVNKIGAILSPNTNEVIIVVQDHLDRVFTLGDSLAYALGLDVTLPVNKVFELRKLRSQYENSNYGKRRNTDGAS